MYPPYRIKIVESLPVVEKKIRRRTLQKAGYNPFQIPANRVVIDLISDSGTGAMSSAQWQALVGASEDFSGQQAYAEFVKEARSLFTMQYIQPVHQGRVAEHLLFRQLLRADDIVASNTHFETTRDNIESLGCQAVDLPDFSRPYCGNMNIKKLASLLKSNKAVRLIILTITNNIRGGQPVSLKNMQQVRNLAQKYRIPVLYDASRFTDNAYFIQQRTGRKTDILRICQRMFSYADTIYLSCKKSVMVNVGGCIATRSRALYRKLQVAVLQQESFPTSGGLAARDLAAMTIGLREAVNERYLRTHLESLHVLKNALENHGVATVSPPGNHAIAVHSPSTSPYAAFSLAAQVYINSGVRGGVFDDQYRLALPRRVYMHEHLMYVAHAIGRSYKKRSINLHPVNDPQKFKNFLIRFKRSGR